jgi:RimJ/RimL family protein N-acetyltransferase
MKIVGYLKLPLWKSAGGYRPSFGGFGYAPEAAQKALQFAFEVLDVPSVFAFTTLQNIASQRVMLKLGMVNTGQNFSHPKVQRGHQFEQHCLYQITKQKWMHSSR